MEQSEYTDTSLSLLLLLCRSASSCEFVVQGRSQVSECCTHGISRTAPSMPSCTDDSERSPFVLEVATALQDPLANTTRFDMRVGAGGGSTFGGPHGTLQQHCGSKLPGMCC